MCMTNSIVNYLMIAQGKGHKTCVVIIVKVTVISVAKLRYS